MGLVLLLLVSGTDLLGSTAAAQDRPDEASLLGTPVVRTISPQAYDGNGQVWDVAQDGRGLLYIASSYGLQQYGRGPVALPAHQERDRKSVV